MSRPDNLYSERLTLRTPSIRDVDSIFKLCRHREILKRTGIPFSPYRREHAVNFIRNVHRSHRKSSAWQWSIRNRVTDELMGMVSLMAIGYAPGTAEIGCWLGKPYWRQGIMSEAFRLVLDHGFRRLKLKRISAKVFPENAWSLGLVNSLGFAYEGRLRKSIKRRGRWHDECVFSILGDEWLTGTTQTTQR